MVTIYTTLFRVPYHCILLTEFEYGVVFRIGTFHPFIGHKGP